MFNRDLGLFETSVLSTLPSFEFYQSFYTSNVILCLPGVWDLLWVFLIMQHLMIKLLKDSCQGVYFVGFLSVGLMKINSSISIFDWIYVEYEQFFIVFKISWTLISKNTLQWLATFISFKMYLSFNSMIICLIRLRMMALQKRCSESLCLRLVKIWIVKSVSTALTWLEAQNDHRL